MIKKHLEDKVATPKRNKSINIDQADNGFLVSSWSEDTNKKMVCKSFDEVITAVKKMLGISEKDMKGEMDEMKSKYRK